MIRRSFINNVTLTSFGTVLAPKSLFSIDNNSSESIKLATKALKANPKYVSHEYQGKQLWGRKLQDSAKLFFKTKEMKKVVREARQKTQ